MRFPHVIALGCLILAVIFTVIVESQLSRRMSKTASSRLAWAAFFSCYGVCVGVVSMLLGYFFQWRDWVSIAVAVPLGFPVFLLAGRVGES